MDLNDGFTNVDQSPDRESLLRFLRKLDQLESVRSYQLRMLEMAPVVPGSRVLDVGCGAGYEIERLAQLTGTPGCAFGLDNSAIMIEEAKRRTLGRSVSVEFLIGDAHQLDFADGTFDLCRSERILLYVQNAERVLREMFRVLRKDGQMAVFDLDYGGSVVDAKDDPITRSLPRFLVESVPNGYVGRQLPRMFKQCGLVEVRVVPHPLLLTYELYRDVVGGVLDAHVRTGELDPSALTHWWGALEDSNGRGEFFCSMLGFVVSGRKPAQPG